MNKFACFFFSGAEWLFGATWLVGACWLGGSTLANGSRLANWMGIRSQLAVFLVVMSELRILKFRWFFFVVFSWFFMGDLDGILINAEAWIK